MLPAVPCLLALTASLRRPRDGLLPAYVLLFVSSQGGAPLPCRDSLPSAACIQLSSAAAHASLYSLTVERGPYCVLAPCSLSRPTSCTARPPASLPLLRSAFGHRVSGWRSSLPPLGSYGGWSVCAPARFVTLDMAAQVVVLSLSPGARADVGGGGRTSMAGASAELVGLVWLRCTNGWAFTMTAIPDWFQWRDRVSNCR